MSGKTEELVGQMATGVDLERVLQQLQLSAVQALKLLDAKCGRRVLTSRRKLAAIHADVLSCRYSSLAVHRLCEILQSEKPELRLKGAMSLLAIARLNKTAGKRKRKGKSLEPTPEDLKLLEILAQHLNPAPLPVLSAADGEKGVDNCEDSK